MIDPILHCYWVLPGKLLAGEYPGDYYDPMLREKIDFLLEIGVLPAIPG